MTAGRTARALLATAIAVLAVAWIVVWIRVVTAPYYLPQTDWAVFKKRFITPSGRVVDTGNDNITHSEGQAYGMILAEAFGDRQTFDRIWNWTRTNLQIRPDDKLLAWLWKPAPDGKGGAVTDQNNASDGELLAAWALTRAAKRWGIYAYEQAAAEMLVDLRRLAVRDTPDGPALLPGLEGFVKPDGLVLNPSYYVFPAFDLIASTFPGSGWDVLARSGENLITKARFGKWFLNPDWTLQSDTSYSLGAPFPPDFGYNAVRIPLHIAWSDPKSPLLEPYANFWREFSDLSTMPATVNLTNNTFGPDPSLPGMQAIARFVLACRTGDRLTMHDMSPVTHEEPYYSASLKLLTKVAVRDVFGGDR